MKVKRYVADSIQEAITRVKNDLGRNAIILHTKPFKEGGFFGLFAKRRFEVIAAVDENIAENSPPKKVDEKIEVPLQAQPSNSTVFQNPVSGTGAQVASQPISAQPAFGPQLAMGNTLNQIPASPLNPALQMKVKGPTDSNQAVLTSNLAPASAPLAAVLPQNTEPVFTPKIPGIKEVVPPEPALKSLHEEIAEVKELIKQVASKPGPVSMMVESPLPERPGLQLLDWLRQELRGLGMEGEIIDYLAQQIPSYILDEAKSSEGDLIEYCKQVLTSRLMFSEPIQTVNSGEQQIVALIGPTGVGKTTTIAKLAANFNLFEGKKVGLITIDTYRIAAVEHLKTYGDIINLPVEVVYTPSEINQSIQNLRDCNLILIDTAGRSPHNQVMMDELKKFLAHSQIGLILLVISATTKYQDMISIAENFSRIAYTHLVFTKLDETFSLGPVVSLAWKIRRPISYLTTGQNVPDDIEVAKPEKLISQLFKKIERPAVK
ncbi:MAG: flagellar biosynthesis protein FlhF [Firmicutes bacterium]|nr:flagellar biosynthesis protein FlhF [Bacillota bacterium]